MDTATVTAPAPDQVLRIPLEQLRPSKYQPKARKADADLVSSVRTHGVIQAGLARPTPGAATPYEIVFGHCRWDASKKADQADMPFVVREIGDAEALELHLVENLQRAGLHPLDEAEGYEQLRKLGHSTDVIAERIDKSKAYVYGRLKLAELGKEGRLAFREGKLNESVALYLARVPGELQPKALKELLGRSFDDEPPSAREAQRILRQQFMLELKKAPFEIADGALVPAAGACTSCPKRTGNQRDLFADVESADVCTDPTCYGKKVDALWQIRTAKAKEAGQKVLSAKESKERWPQRYSSANDGLVSLDDSHYNIGNKSWRKVLGKEAPSAILARNPHTNEIVELVDQAAAMKVARAKGAVQSLSQPAKEKAAKELGEKLHAAALSAIADAAEREMTLAGWRFLVYRLADRDYDHSVAKRRGLDELPLEKCTLEQLRALLVEIVLDTSFSPPYNGEVDEDLPTACKAFGVDLKAIEKRLAAAAAAGEKAAATKPKGKAK
jgi:ParB/RepB/Spo0J family partition protein